MENSVIEDEYKIICIRCGEEVTLTTLEYMLFLRLRNNGKVGRVCLNCYKLIEGAKR